MIYAIGDIHGQHVMLKSLLAKLTSLPLRRDDVVVFLGDYVDRGENSQAVIEMLLQWQEERPGTIFLRGNHEQLMLDIRDSPATADPVERARIALSWLRHGGGEALLSYSAPGIRPWQDVSGDDATTLSPAVLAELASLVDRWVAVIPDSHWEFLNSTQMEYVTSRYHFVHAGLLPPGQKWDSIRPGIDPRLWIREPFLSNNASFGGRLVVFGHTPQQNRRPLIQRNKICLDTGAVFGGPLVAGIFNTREGTPTKLHGVIEVPFARSLSALFKPIPVDKSRIRKRRTSTDSSAK